MKVPTLSRCSLTILCLSLLLGALPAQAAPCDRLAAKDPGRPRVGLVLGGGGARGAAHVGVLKVLERMQIPIDCIAGNSMGAIVGGLYASGLSPEEIEREMVGMDWDDVLDDKPPRPEQQFRRKRDDDNYLVKKYIGYENGKLELPLGWIQGQKFDLELARLTKHVAGVQTFDELPIPFRAVATDIETGEALVLDSGNLARSIRASMAVPGAFDAVEIEGRLLVDGLVSNNVPIDVARAMGADIVIVVDVGTPLMKRAEINSILTVVGQISNILSARNVEEQLRTLSERDVYIKPDLGDITTSDFKRAADAIAVGEKAANASQASLATLVAGLGRPAANVAERRATSKTPPEVAFVRVQADTTIGEDVLLYPFQPLIGKPLDDATLKQAIEELYGWNIFESVRYEVVQEGGRKGLLLHIKEKSWGPNYVQLGLALSSDMDGEGTWDVGVSVLKTALNRYAGEARFAGQIGENPLAFAEFYQPIGAALRYFVNVRMFYDSRNSSRFVGDDQVQDYRVHRYGGDLSIGRTLADWGEIRIGLRRYGGEADLHVGDLAASSNYDFDSGELYGRAMYDTLDNRNFPHAGSLARVEWSESITDLGAEKGFSQLDVSAAAAHSWGKNSAFAGVQFQYTADGTAPIQNRFRAGGLTQLSGFVQNELSGQQVLLLRSGFYRRLGNIEWLPLYAGMTVEYGNVYEKRDDISLATDKAMLAASVFLGVDSVLGPIYLAYGHAEQGHDSVYLFLGRLF